MSNPYPEVARYLALGLLTLGRRHGLAAGEVLRGTDVGLQEVSFSRARVTREDEHQIIRNLTAALPPGTPLPLEAGLDFHLWAIPIWGKALVTAPTFGDALAFSVPFTRTLPLDAWSELELGRTAFTVRFHNDTAPADVADFVLLRYVIFCSMMAGEVLGHDLPLTRVSFAMPEPPYAAAFQRLSAAPIAWDAERSEVTADRRWLRSPLMADPVAHARAVARCWRMRQEFDDRRSMTSRVRQVLTTGSLAPVGVGAVAAALHVSERSVRRGLAAEGTTFRALLAIERQEACDRWFAEGVSITEVAARLGYADVTSFSHAFKRWTGVSPRQWLSETATGGGHAAVHDIP